MYLHTYAQTHTWNQRFTKQYLLCVIQLFKKKLYFFSLKNYDLHPTKSMSLPTNVLQPKKKPLSGEM